MGRETLVRREATAVPGAALDQPGKGARVEDHVSTNCVTCHL